MKALEFIVTVSFIKLLTTSTAISIEEPIANKEPPKIIEGPLYETITIINSTVVLKCRASGNPEPKIIWENEGVEVQGSNFRILPTGDLQIKEVKREDSGTYVCKAVNDYGTVLKSTILAVKLKTKIQPKQHTVEAPIGKNVFLTCNIRHDPSLNVKMEWFKDGKGLESGRDYNFSRIIIYDNYLMIRDIKKQHSGDYICLVRTEIDEARATINVAVQDVPDAPIIENVTCNGDIAEIVWKAQSDNFVPIMFYNIEYNTSVAPEKWEVGISNVRPSNFYKFPYHMKPGLSYSFRLKAYNKRGYSQPSLPSKSCTTAPGTPFKNPDNVKTKSGGPDKLTITWTPLPETDHSGPDLHYRVFWRSDTPDASQYEKTIYDSNSSTLTTTVRPEFTKYFIKVIAINEIGESNAPAEEVIGYSGEDRPLLAPTNFKVVKLISGKSVLLKWDHVSADSLRGHFKGYKLETWTPGEEDYLHREFLIDNDVNEFLFTKLKPFTKNFVRLRAYNSRFDGPSTVINFTTPEGPPSEVTHLKAQALSSSELLVTWDKPLEPNGQLIGYKVYYEELKSFYGEIPFNSEEKLATSAKLTGLKPNTKYSIQVVAETQGGVGPWKSVVQQTL